MKSEMEKVRNWAAARLRSGAVPDRSWYRHVRLIEALDAMLHDMSVAENASRSEWRTRHALRVVGQTDQVAERIAVPDWRQGRKARTRR